MAGVGGRYSPMCPGREWTSDMAGRVCPQTLQWVHITYIAHTPCQMQTFLSCTAQTHPLSAFESLSRITCLLSVSPSFSKLLRRKPKGITRAEALLLPIKDMREQTMGFSSSRHLYSIYKVDQQDLKICLAKKMLQ